MSANTQTVAALPSSLAERRLARLEEQYAALVAELAAVKLIAAGALQLATELKLAADEQQADEAGPAVEVEPPSEPTTPRLYLVGKPGA